MSSSSFNNKKNFKCDYDKGKKTLNGVPIWMLFIDKDCHFQGEMFFDNSSKNGYDGEPGYNSAMHLAFDYVLTNLHKKLDAEEFKNIHHLCVGTVENVNSKEKDFRPSSYGIILSQISEAAKAEWKSEKLIVTMKDIREGLDVDSFLSFFSPINGYNVVSNYEKEDQDTIKDKVNTLFGDYYSQLDEAKDDDDKILSAIVSLCRKLEIGHFFSDGNQRTIVFIILNKLLIENGFTPVILDDPVVFDGYHSQNELIQDVKFGMSNFLACVTSQSLESKASDVQSVSNDNLYSQSFFSSSQSREKEDLKEKPDKNLLTRTRVRGKE